MDTNWTWIGQLDKEYLDRFANTDLDVNISRLIRLMNDIVLDPIKVIIEKILPDDWLYWRVN